MLIVLIGAVSYGCGWTASQFGCPPSGVIAASLAVWVAVAMYLEKRARFPYVTKKGSRDRKLATEVVGNAAVLWHKSMRDPKLDLDLDFDDVSIAVARPGLAVDAGVTDPHEADAIEAAAALGVLRGWHVQAPAGDRKVCVVCVHGGTRDRRSFLRHARCLHDAGYGVLLCDLREHGTSSSKGDGLTYGSRESVDASAMVRYARKTLGYKYVVAAGTSMGAAASVIAAVVHAKKDRLAWIDGVLCENAFSNRKKLIVDMLAPVLGFGPLGRLVARSVATLAVWRAHRQSGLSDGPWELEELVSEVSPRPIVFMHGTKDATIDMCHSVALHQAAQQPKSLWIADGAVHTGLFDRDPGEWEARLIQLVNDSINAADSMRERNTQEPPAYSP